MSTSPEEPRQEAAFFSTIRSWGITRGPNGVIGGVIEGVGDRIGMDKLPARIIAVVAAVMITGLILPAYAAAWGLLPDRDGNIIIQNFGRGRPNVGALIGIAILLLIAPGINIAQRGGHQVILELSSIRCDVHWFSPIRYVTKPKPSVALSHPLLALFTTIA